MPNHNLGEWSGRAQWSANSPASESPTDNHIVAVGTEDTNARPVNRCPSSAWRSPIVVF